MQPRQESLYQSQIHESQDNMLKESGQITLSLNKIDQYFEDRPLHLIANMLFSECQPDILPLHSHSIQPPENSI